MPASSSFDVLQGLVIAVDTKDRYTKRHSEDVARYALFIADRIGLERETRRTLGMAGLLHDVGKIGIPDTILRKPAALTADEYAIVKQHVALGDLDRPRRAQPRASSAAASATTTSAGTATATSTAWPARTSRSSPGSWPWPTRSRR